MNLWRIKIKIGYSIFASVFFLGCGIFIGSKWNSKVSKLNSTQIVSSDPSSAGSSQTVSATGSRRLRQRPGVSESNRSNGQVDRENMLRRGNVVEVGAPYSLLDKNFKINPYALEMAGIPENKSDKVQQLIDRAWEQLAVLARGQVSRNLAESNEVEQRHVYDVKPFEAGAKAVLDDLGKGFTKEFGSQSTSLLLSALHPDRYFGNLGKFPMRLIVEPRPDQGVMSISNSKTEYTLNIIDPLSGDVTTMMKSDNIAIFEKALGKGVDEIIGR